jgi:putative nucleotidyltransferase with HDIG domain
LERLQSYSTPQQLVKEVLQLVSLPEVYLRLQETIDDPLHTRQQVADVLAYDPALAARILRIANSSYYGFPATIDTIEAATSIVGEIDLRNLLLATSVVCSMSSLTYKGIDLKVFWLHSLRCGIGARLIAKNVGGCDAEILFLAGILHDLGILVIYQHDETLANAVWRHMETNHQLRDQAEREMFGFDHAEVGALLVEAWGLAEQLRILVGSHHQYQMAGEHRQETMILALANLLAELEPGVDPETNSQLTTLTDKLDLNEAMLGEVCEALEQQCDEIQNVILG